MKVVQFIVGGHGGAERFYVKLLSALGDYGVDQHSIHNDDAALTEAVAKSGVPATVVPFQKGRDRAGRRLYREAIAAIKPDVVIHWMNRAARRAIVGSHINVGRLGGFYPTRYYWKCDHLIANTPQIYEDIIGQGWPAAATRMISNFGELTPEAAADRATLGVPPGAFMLLALGRFDPWKCFDVLISAMKYLPENTHLCLAGTGERASLFQALALSEGVAERIKFLGWRNDQAALLKACDLCVVPSRHEPLGNVILEAWSLGVPVVAAASEGPRWLIKHGQTGLLAEPKNATDLAEKIRQALNNGALRASLAQKGHSEWANKFSKDIICGQYVEFLNEIREARRPSSGARLLRLIKGLAPLSKDRPSQKEQQSSTPQPTYLRRKMRQIMRPRLITLGGVTLEIDRKRLPRGVIKGIYKEEYEAHERRLVCAVVMPGDRVLEIGAGIGFISLVCAQRCGANAVLSYEANPANIPIIRRNFELNGLSPQLRDRAIATSNGTRRLFVATNLLSTSLIDRGGATEHEVATDDISDVIAEFDPTCIVMDVEGAEIDILSATQLSGVNKIIVETHPHIVGQKALDAMDADLVDKGFSRRNNSGKVWLYLRQTKKNAEVSTL